jgi:hypothetical protein
MRGRALLALVAASLTLATGCASATKTVPVAEISSVSVVRRDTRFQIFFEARYADSSSRSLTAKLALRDEPLAETGDGPPVGADHLAVAMVSSATRARLDETAPGKAAFVEIDKAGDGSCWVLVDIPPETERYWVKVPAIAVPDDDTGPGERPTSTGEFVLDVLGTLGLGILVIATAPISIPIISISRRGSRNPGGCSSLQ